MPTTWGFAQVGHDILTSAMCKYRQQFQHDEQHSAVGLIINIINFNQQQFGAGRNMNAATAASPVRCASCIVDNPYPRL